MSGTYTKLLRDYRFVLFIIVLIASIVAISTIGIEQGLDLRGGSIIQLELEKSVDTATMNTMVSILDKRLNIYGVKDVKIRSSGNKNIIIEIAGVDPNDVYKLIGSTGSFEAKIANKTALSGSDIRSVKSYEVFDTQWQVPFDVSPAAAQKFAEVAKGHAGEEVQMYLDGELISSPLLDETLASGNPVTEVSVSGVAETEEDAQAEAKETSTVLKSGSLPVKVKVVGVSTVSSELGDLFVRGALIAGLIAIIVISLIIFLRYRVPGLVVPIIITSVSEIIIVLGISAVLHWNIDLAAIAGLIASVGTGVDDQIIITDEILHDDKVKSKKSRVRTSTKIKNALFIVFASAGTLIAAMIPLAYMGFARGATGIGMLSGFAFTTVLGVLVGIFITRPAYAKFMELRYKN